MIMSVEKCFECNSGSLTPGLVTMTGVRNREEFAVKVPGLACDSCGYKTIDNHQSGAFTKAVSDAYKAAHGLLTGSELRERRADWLKMSQQAFADYLGVGLASIKRWESGQVQDRAMDELIRLKTDPEAARSNLRALEVQVPEEYILRLGSHDLDLRFSLGQRFTDRPQMTMGRFPVDQCSDLGNEVLAA